MQQIAKPNRWGPPPVKLDEAVISYLQGEKVQSISVQLDIRYNVLYRWFERLEIPLRGRRENYRKEQPEPNVLAAIVAYKREEKELRSILKECNTDWKTLYRWLDRFEIPKRRFFRHNGKVGHPLKAPRILKCDWCGDPLSEYQISRRRKYCCRECQDEGIEAARREKMRPCPAPGCTGLIDDDTPFCSWECHKVVMEARFG